VEREEEGRERMEGGMEERKGKKEGKEKLCHLNIVIKGGPKRMIFV
jgi:hypothetical protein